MLLQSRCMRAGGIVESRVNGEGKGEAWGAVFCGV